jgi:hypothetical protein
LAGAGFSSIRVSSMRPLCSLRRIFGRAVHETLTPNSSTTTSFVQGPTTDEKTIATIEMITVSCAVSVPLPVPTTMQVNVTDPTVQGPPSIFSFLDPPKLTSSGPPDISTIKNPAGLYLTYVLSKRVKIRIPPNRLVDVQITFENLSTSPAALGGYRCDGTMSGYLEAIPN